MNKQAFLILVDRWLSGAATAEEEELLINYYNSFQDNHEWNEAELGSKEIIAGRILNNLQSQTTQLNPFDRRSEAKAVVHRIPFLKTTWFKYAAAILIMAGIGAYLWNTNQKEPVKGTLPAEASIAKVDVSPGFNRATLTLSDGKQVILDSAASETINDGTLPIKNKDGQLLYGSLSSPFEKGGSGDQRGNADRRGISQYNTMSTPKGGQYRLTLSDGTRVWLNAASSITYP
ncbi:MAG: hypothetical protein J7497_17170, partial [Chitinophagaceae bacterium]|nr:hypothetical protein [Chitinophagaceae bacterium]